MKTTFAEKSVAHADLARFIFKENIKHKAIYLDLEKLNGVKDLFYFLIHLLCKGMIELYGENNSISIDELDEERVYQINLRLRCIGIKVHIMSEVLDEPRVGVFYKTPNSEKIADYQLLMYTRLVKHTLWFDVFHYVPDRDHLCHV